MPSFYFIVTQGLSALFYTVVEKPYEIIVQPPSHENQIPFFFLHFEGKSPKQKHT